VKRTYAVVDQTNHATSITQNADIRLPFRDASTDRRGDAISLRRKRLIVEIVNLLEQRGQRGPVALH